MSTYSIQTTSNGFNRIKVNNSKWMLINSLAEVTNDDKVVNLTLNRRNGQELSYNMDVATDTITFNGVVFAGTLSDLFNQLNVIITSASVGSGGGGGGTTFNGQLTQGGSNVSNTNPLPINQSGVSATGSLAALNAAQALSLNGATGFAVDVRGTFSATILIQGTVDGTNWITLSVLPIGAGLNVAQVASITGVGAWWGSGNGLQQVRATMSAYTSGTATVVLRAMQAAGMVFNLPAGQTTQPVSGTVTANIGTGALAAGTNIIGYTPFPYTTMVVDVASAALTSTTTTAAITPTWGTSYQINIPVTTVTGTTPTLDVRIEESDDNGTNWFTVYDFPRITATGIYRSPLIPYTGNRVRYVQTVGGTTPSFTRAINRNQSNYNALAQRQLIDRTISLTTLNSTTPVLLARDCGNATQLIINVGAITTTAPQLQLEGSDDFGLTWYAIGTPLTAVASSTVQVTVPTINAAALRARVSTAGVGVTAGYVMIKAHD